MSSNITASNMTQNGVITPSVHTNTITIDGHTATGVYSATTLHPTSDMLVSKGALDIFKKELMDGTLGGDGSLGSTSQSLISTPLTDPYFLQKDAWDVMNWELSNNRATFLGTSSATNHLKLNSRVFRVTGYHALFIYIEQMTTGAVHLYDDHNGKIATFTQPGVHTIEVNVDDLAMDYFYLRASGVYPEDRVVIGAFAVCFVYTRLKEYLKSAVVSIVKNSDDIASIIPPAPLAAIGVPGLIKPGNTVKVDSEGTLDVDPDFLPSATEDSRGVITVGPGLLVNENGVLSATPESIGAYVPKAATDKEMGVIRVYNPIEPTNPIASSAGYGGEGEPLGVIYDNIDTTTRTGNFLALPTLSGTLPFTDVIFIFKSYMSSSDAVRYQVAINPATGERVERIRYNSIWGAWGVSGQSGLEAHNSSIDAHPEMREVLISALTDEMSRRMIEHNEGTGSHADMREVIDVTLPQYIRDLVNTHNLNPEAHEDIRQYVRDHVSVELDNYDSNKLYIHNTDPTAHEDIRLAITDEVVEHNSDLTSHPDIRNIIADEVAILNQKIQLLGAEIAATPNDLEFTNTLPDEWPDSLKEGGVLLVMSQE